MQQPERISRHFRVQRSETFVQTYTMTTFSSIWKDAPSDRPNLQKLYVYLRSLMIDGAADSSVRKSISGAKKLMVETERRPCYLTTMAAESNYVGAGNQQHPIIQSYLMYNSPNTIATEIPVWSNEGECPEDDELFRGHIDGLEYNDDDTFLLWDAKPDADKETKAASQLFRYRKYLALRTGIPLKAIEAVYFDKDNAFYII